VSQKGGTQNKTLYFKELLLRHFFLNNWPIKLAYCQKQIEFGRHRIQLIEKVTNRDETISIAMYVLIGEVNSPNETTSIAMYVCDI
jgi:hypothetical protein